MALKITAVEVVGERILSNLVGAQGRRTRPMSSTPDWGVRSDGSSAVYPVNAGAREEIVVATVFTSKGQPSNHRLRIVVSDDLYRETHEAIAAAKEQMLAEGVHPRRTIESVRVTAVGRRRNL